MATSAFCGECGAWKGALGLGPTLELYVEHIVEIFREVWRVLRKDGTCWINLGDSYSGRRDGKLKPKDLVGMPWRVAFALQDDGWWLRSPGIWDKPNPMPESVAGRLTTSHEYVFMLAKSGDRLYWAHPDRPGARSKPSPDYRYVCDETGELVEVPPKGWRAKDSGRRRVNLWQGHDYFFDGYAIREPLAEVSVARISQATFWKQQGGPKDYPNGVNPARSTRRSLENLARRTPSGWNVNPDRSDLLGRYGQREEKRRGHRRPHQGFIDRRDDMTAAEQRAGGTNARTVWRIAARPFSGKHFTTFPEDLPRRCILAGTSERGVCAECGAPWERMVDKRAHGPIRQRRDGGPWRGVVDWLIGGIPCQPYSRAGKRKGATDERNLWPDARRVIEECRPSAVFLENVPGIAGYYFDSIGPELRGLGYWIEAGLFSAEEVGAPHIRERSFVQGYADRQVLDFAKRGMEGHPLREGGRDDGSLGAGAPGDQPATAADGLVAYSGSDRRRRRHDSGSGRGPVADDQLVSAGSGSPLADGGGRRREREDVVRQGQSELD